MQSPLRASAALHTNKKGNNVMDDGLGAARGIILGLILMILFIWAPLIYIIVRLVNR